MRLKGKYLILACLTAFCFTAHAYTPTDTIRVTPYVKKKKPYPFQPLVLKTSPTGFFYGGVFPLTSEYRLTAEVTTSRTQSDQVSIGYLSKNVFWTIIEKSTNTAQQRTLKCTGYRLQYMHKFYLVNRRHHSPYGFYVGPQISYANAKISLGLNRYYKNSYYDVRHFNANLIFGVQVGKLGRLTMDICGGFGYKNNTIWYHASSYRVFQLDASEFGAFYNNSFHAMFDISLGYSFK